MKRAVLGVLVLAISRVIAEEIPTSRMTDQVPQSLLSTNAASYLAYPRSGPLAETQNWKYTSRVRRLQTEGQRWETFESEYGIQTPGSSKFESTLQLGKYQLDKTAFAANEFVENLENMLKFEYDRGHVAGRTTERRRYFNPMVDAWENVKFKSDVNLHVTGRAYMGLRLEIPFGD